jgi:hypothetical protein
MAHVWVLSEGEVEQGERVLAVYKSYDGALEDLQEAADMAGGLEIQESFSAAVFKDGVHYTIIREQELYS